MKLLIVHNSIESEQIILDSLKEDVIVKKASDFENVDNLIEDIGETNFEILSFIYHFSDYYEYNIPFFERTDNTYTYFNDNIIKLIRV